MKLYHVRSNSNNHCLLLKAFSEYLGNKPFLFGEKPSIADASLFGFLAEIITTHDESNWLRKAIEDDFKVQSMSPVSNLNA